MTVMLQEKPMNMQQDNGQSTKYQENLQRQDRKANEQTQDQLIQFLNRRQPEAKTIN